VCMCVCVCVCVCVCESVTLWGGGGCLKIALVYRDVSVCLTHTHTHTPPSSSNNFHPCFQHSIGEHYGEVILSLCLHFINHTHCWGLKSHCDVLSPTGCFLCLHKGVLSSLHVCVCVCVCVCLCLCVWLKRRR